MKKELLQRADEDLQCEKSWDWEGVTVLRAKATLPQFRGRRARRLNRYYRRYAQAYLKYCEAELFPRAASRCREAMAVSAPWSVSYAELSYTVSHESDSILSLRTDAIEENLPPRLHIRRADTWDLRDALPIPLGALFPEKSAWRKRLRRFLRDTACAQIESGRAEYYPTYRRALRLYFSSRNFYLTPEGLRLFYPMYTVAPAREGIVEFLVPYAENGPFLPTEKE